MTKPVTVALAISKRQISSNMSRIRISGFGNNINSDYNDHTHTKQLDSIRQVYFCG